jgi:hypothetical protein
MFHPRGTVVSTWLGCGILLPAWRRSLVRAGTQPRGPRSRRRAMPVDLQPAPGPPRSSLRASSIAACSISSLAPAARSAAPSSAPSSTSATSAWATPCRASSPPAPSFATPIAGPFPFPLLRRRPERNDRAGPISRRRGDRVSRCFPPHRQSLRSAPRSPPRPIRDDPPRTARIATSMPTAVVGLAFAWSSRRLPVATQRSTTETGRRCSTSLRDDHDATTTLACLGTRAATPCRRG